MATALNVSKKKTKMDLIDSKSAVGSGVTILFTTIAGLTLQEWAAVIAIITGLVTIGYTIYKWANDEKHKNKKQ
jgi:hypothetical protein